MISKELKERIQKIDPTAKYVLFINQNGMTPEKIHQMSNFFQDRELKIAIIMVEDVNLIRMEELLP